MFVAGKRPSPGKLERRDDTQGTELFLWAWGCCGAVSMPVCVPVPVPAHVVPVHPSRGHPCTPLGPGIALLSSPTCSCKEGSSWLSPCRKVSQGVGLMECLSCVPSVPLPEGVWFWVCCWRSQAAHGEIFCTDQARMPPKDTLLSWSHLVASPVGFSEYQTQRLHVPWECQALQSLVLFTECCCSINLCDWLVISVITN